MNILTVYTLNSHLLTLKAHNHKMDVLLLSTKVFEASKTNSVDPDQTAPYLGPQCLPLCLCKIDIFRCSYFAGVLRTK